MYGHRLGCVQNVCGFLSARLSNLSGRQYFEMKELIQLSDREIVAGIIANNSRIIKYFFFEKCSRIFVYIINSVFDGKIQKEELLNELFIYLAKDDWKKLREFNFNSSLMTWISIVATRFFVRKRDKLIENDSSESLLLDIKEKTLENLPIDNINLQMAIDILPNHRYRQVIQLIDLQDVPYKDVASLMEVSIANLYNIHRRAIAQLRLILIER